MVHNALCWNHQIPMVLRTSCSYGVNTMTRDPTCWNYHMKPLHVYGVEIIIFLWWQHYSSWPHSFAPFVVAMIHYAAQYERSFVYINSSIVISVESIVFSHTRLLQLQTDSTRAPIAVPTTTSRNAAGKPPANRRKAARKLTASWQLS